VLIFHKFVDVLRGASHEIPLHLYYVTPADVQALVDRIIDAEKFDFGDLPLEVDPQRPDTVALPRFTADELEAWCDGLLPLPAPVCWYEFNIKHRAALLVRDYGDGWGFARFDWTNPLVYDGHEILCQRSSRIGDWHFRMGGSQEFLNDIVTPDRQAVYAHYGANASLGLYLTLMINSPSTELRREPAPERLNRGRLARGRTPLADHRVVTIVPERYLRQSRLEAGFTRLPPRLHSRRSHIRTLHRGEPNERRILIPRCWVMLTSEAEVSHEYRIGGAKQ
jgi:hypothetical protein